MQGRLLDQRVGLMAVRAVGLYIQPDTSISGCGDSDGPAADSWVAGREGRDLSRSGWLLRKG